MEKIPAEMVLDYIYQFKTLNKSKYRFTVEIIINQIDSFKRKNMKVYNKMLIAYMYRK